MRNTKAIDFTKGNVARNLLIMYLPLYAAYFCTTLYNIIGGLWVGNLLGENAFAAQAQSVPLVMLFSAILIGATNGVTIVLSKYLGAKNKDKIGSTLIVSFVSLSLFSSKIIKWQVPVFLRKVQIPNLTFNPSCYPRQNRFLQNCRNNLYFML